MKTVLVTTGATFPFDALFECVLDAQVLASLASRGVTEIRVQYGSSSASKAAFERIKSPTIKLTGFALTGDMAAEFRSAWLVISHAGTGTILDVLRLQPPRPVLVVVANPVLMHGHQAEVALALERMRCLVYAREATPAGILKALDCLDDEFQDLPTKQSIASLINYEAGL